VPAPASVEAALLDLGHQLAAYRDAAGLTQQQLAQRIGCARSTVAMAETGHRRSAGFWRRADDELTAAGTFAAAFSKIEAMAETSRLPPLRAGEDRGAMRTVTALARCPHCDHVIPLTALIGLSVTPDVPGSGHQTDT
jgi:DNA-binding XRE family transcriptional regulator